VAAKGTFARDTREGNICSATKTSLVRMHAAAGKEPHAEEPQERRDVITQRGFARDARAIASPRRTISAVDLGGASSRPASITNSCAAMEEKRTAVASSTKGRRAGVGCLVRLCERRRSSDFPNGISPTSAPVLRDFPSARFHPASACLTHARTHARARTGRREETLKVLRQG